MLLCTALWLHVQLTCWFLEAGPESNQSCESCKTCLHVQTPGAAVHWYGKAGIAAGRKLGHITITAGAA